jgi:glutamate N-acetyltransferase/amino-acid N-acetyltransferase
MPMEKVRKGIGLAARALARTGGHDAARAIRTTDTFEKEFALELTVDGKKVRIGGMAKGAGMIEPNMATMLGFVTTDAAVEHGALEECLRAAVGVTFNRISVDGDQSCNDTVLLLANGEAKNRPLNAKHPDWVRFSEAVSEVCRRLAFMIVEDGEGATKFVTVKVVGARTAEDARKAVRAVANSLLVKTSWFGRDPNWGRVIDAVGYSGADVRQDKVDIDYDAVPAVRCGAAVPGMLKDLEAVLSHKSFTLLINLNQGEAEDTVYTCDCTLEYVRINSEYLT